MHSRVAVSGLCFPTLSATEAIEAVASLGVSTTSMPAVKLREAGPDAVVEACRHHDVAIVAVPGSIGFDLSLGPPSAATRQQAQGDIDLASAVGASSVYGLTGRRAAADWSTSADAYVQAMAEIVAYAAERHVSLAIEPASWLYADMTFVHTFHDALEVAPRADMQVCLDLFHVWTERELREDIVKHVDRIAHVQLGDFALGDRSLPSRAVPDDGGIPLATVVQWLVEAGYQGPFDLELNGPRIDAIGHREAAARAAAWLDELLVELGA